MVFPAKLNFAWSKLTEPPGSVEIPPQSPGAGAPLPVAPPMVLSFTDVKVIGDAAVPAPFNVPSTVSVVPFVALMMVPGWIVRVMLVGTSTVVSKM